jgi:1,4-alpha-glucan branching enzyme
MASPKEKSKKRKITFSLSSDTAADVALAGDFNNWNPASHPMKKNKNGVWEKIVMLDIGRYEYKFLVDGQWESDPKNNQVCKNSFGTVNNVLMVTAS